MKNFLFLFIIFPLAMAACSGAKYSLKKHPHLKYFPKEIRNAGLYFGMTDEALRTLRPGATLQDTDENFRDIYVESGFSENIDQIIYYLDKTGEKELYELILIMAEGVNNKDIAFNLLGPPNHEGKEWRFSASETGEPFTLAAWTFQNKIIFACDCPGSEWEEGFN